MFKRIYTTTLISCVIFSLHTSKASENGLGTWPIGVNTSMNGMIVVPDTTQFYNYTQFYKANQFNDAHGNSAINDFSSKTLVNAFRIDQGWNNTFKGFGLSSGIIIPAFYLSADIAGQHDSTKKIGDITLKPIMFGNHSKDYKFYHYFSPLDISLPTGSYSKDNLLNTGVNYYSYMPNYGFTWLPNNNLEISGTFSAVLNTKNTSTDYKSGDFLHYEYSIGYSPNEKIQLGLQGFFLKQITDDKLSNQTYLNGYRGQAVGVGPQFRYSFSPGKALILKYQNEFATKNRAEGDRFWLQFTFPL